MMALISMQMQWSSQSIANERKSTPVHESGAPYEYFEGMAMGKLIKDVIKVNDSTVKIVLTTPNSPFLANVAMAFMVIVSPTAVLKHGKAFDQNPIGTGPYILRTWKKDDYLELEAFDKYWGEKALTKRIIIRVIPDNQIRLLELKRGSVHIMDLPNPSDMAQAQADPNLKVLTQEGLNISNLIFNMKKPPFDKLEVREAISMAIDRQRIVNEIFLGFGVVAKKFYSSLR